MTRNFVDYHCHLLPCLDDGAVDQRDSLEMASALAGFGFTTVHCTPHLSAGGFENAPERVRRATRSLQRLLDDAGIALRLVPGTEHYGDDALPGLLPGALTVGSSRYLLVEIPFRFGGETVPGLVAEIRRQCLAPLFAHPERCRAFQLPLRPEGVRGALSSLFGKEKSPAWEGSLLADLQRSGCRFQGNLGSFAGVYGREVKQQALFLLSQGVYSCLGSDAHSSQGLAETLASGFQEVVAAIGEAAATELLRGFAE
jgi:protein-tyrosine phosphatase